MNKRDSENNKLLNLLQEVIDYSMKEEADMLMLGHKGLRFLNTFQEIIYPRVKAPWHEPSPPVSDANDC